MEVIFEVLAEIVGELLFEGIGELLFSVWESSSQINEKVKTYYQRLLY